MVLKHRSPDGVARPCRNPLKCPFQLLPPSEQGILPPPGVTHREFLGHLPVPGVPGDALKTLGGIFDDRDITPLSVVPTGSILYKTQARGVPPHDFDFVAFVAPGVLPEKRRAHQIQEEEVDLHLMAVEQLPETITTSSMAFEAVAAHQLGLGFYGDPARDPLGRALLRSLRTPMPLYFNTTRRTARSKTQAFSYPVDLSDANERKNFKHWVRKDLYRRRLFGGGTPLDTLLDPRLQPHEQELYYRALETGYYEPLEQNPTFR